MTVRLSSAQIALACKPRVVRAAELRLLLETLTNDDSEQVKEAVLDFLLSGPSFSEANHAITTAEWLASLSLPLPFLFRFGQRHADLLSLSCSSLSERVDDPRLAAILAGAYSVWGEVNFGLVRSAQIVHGTAEALEGRKSVAADICSALHELFRTGTVPTLLKEHPTALAFGQACLQAAGEPGRRRVLLDWTGFNAETNRALLQWAITGSFPQNGCFGFDKEALLLSDELLPSRVDCEISYIVDFAPSDASSFGIARVRVMVKALTFGQSGTFGLIARSAQYRSSRISLAIKEVGRVKLVFSPVVVSIPVSAAHAFRPEFLVERIA
jgi:hypothetical protein